MRFVEQAHLLSYISHGYPLEWQKIYLPFSAWLEDIGLPMYRRTFEAELIDAFVLHELTLVRFRSISFEGHAQRANIFIFLGKRDKGALLRVEILVLQVLLLLVLFC